MPKKNADYPARLDLFVRPETRREVISIAYHMGHKGVYAKSGRLLLEKAILDYVEGLSQREKREYDAIMQNVMIAEG